MQRNSFKGDSEAHVDELIVASRKPEVDASVLRERTLVPYFNDAEVPVGKLAGPLESKKYNGKKPYPSQKVHHSKKNRNLKSNSSASNGSATGSAQGELETTSSSGISGKSPLKDKVISNKNRKSKVRNGKNGASENDVLHPARNGSRMDMQEGTQQNQGSDTNSSAGPKKNGKMTKGKKHNREPSHKNLSDLADRPNGTNVARPRKRYEYDNGHGNGDPASLPSRNGMGHHSISSAMVETPGNRATQTRVASKSAMDAIRGERFAGPAFTLSPTPDTLPLPTSLLIANATADRMQTGLVL